MYCVPHCKNTTNANVLPFLIASKIQNACFCFAPKMRFFFTKNDVNLKCWGNVVWHTNAAQQIHQSAAQQTFFVLHLCAMPHYFDISDWPGPLAVRTVRGYMYVCVCWFLCVCSCMCVLVCTCITIQPVPPRLVGWIKLHVSFAKYRLFYRALLQKRPIILSILLTEATP